MVLHQAFRARRAQNIGICGTVNPQTTNVEFGGFDASRFLILRGGIPGFTGSSPGAQSRRFLVRGLAAVRTDGEARASAATRVGARVRRHCLK